MPAPRVSEADLRRTLDAIRAHGSIKRAAIETGVSKSTLDYHARLIRERWPEALPSGERRAGWAAAKMDAVEMPPIPSAAEPLEEWLDRREAAFRRKRAAADAQRWMRFTITEPGPFGLAFVGDPHGDDDGCDLPKLRADVRTIRETTALYGVGLGDWINAWIGRLSRLYAHQGTTEGEAWRFAEWLLGQPIWMLLLLGNHDLWHGAGSPLRWMVHRTPLVDWQAQFVVASGDAEWRVWAAHDFPGRSQYNKAHGPLKRAMLTGSEADLYIAGHTHCFTLIEDQDEHTGRPFWAARARGYKALDQYAHQLGFGQQQDRGQSIVAVCDPETRRMRCFSDVQEGAEFLTWLRIRAGFGGRVRVRAAA